MLINFGESLGCIDQGINYPWLTYFNTKRYIAGVLFRLVFGTNFIPYNLGKEIVMHALYTTCELFPDFKRKFIVSMPFCALIHALHTRVTDNESSKLNAQLTALIASVTLHQTLGGDGMISGEFKTAFKFGVSYCFSYYIEKALSRDFNNQDRHPKIIFSAFAIFWLVEICCNTMPGIKIIPSIEPFSRFTKIFLNSINPSTKIGFNGLASIQHAPTRDV